MTGEQLAHSSSSADQVDCVEVVPASADVRVRDTKGTSGSPTFGPDQWQAFPTAIARSDGQ
jgi:hypothetical protein